MFSKYHATIAASICFPFCFFPGWVKDFFSSSALWINFKKNLLIPEYTNSFRNLPQSGLVQVGDVLPPISFCTHKLHCIWIYFKILRMSSTITVKLEDYKLQAVECLQHIEDNSKKLNKLVSTHEEFTAILNQKMQEFVKKGVDFSRNYDELKKVVYFSVESKHRFVFVLRI